MPTCPQGHSSSATDYCDVCGSPMSTGADPAAVGAAVGPSSPRQERDAVRPAAEAKSCPHCQTGNPAAALFCENCGYDFTTGQAPTPVPGPASEPSPESASASGLDGPGVVEWVVEVWVDPHWYEAQGLTDPCPSPGMPTVVPLPQRPGQTALIGRRSTSRNIHPEVDVVMDTGVSRRHAELSFDGQRWWIEDLQSANGTYLAASSEPSQALPTVALPAGRRTEIPPGGRVYVGGWTRLVIRRAAGPERSPV